MFSVLFPQKRNFSSAKNVYIHEVYGAYMLLACLHFVVNHFLLKFVFVPLLICSQELLHKMRSKVTAVFMLLDILVRVLCNLFFFFFLV